MKQIIETNWLGQKAFESKIGEHKILMDTAIEKGGTNKGPSPLPLIMSSYAGCMGVDTIAILLKKKIIIDEFKIFTEGIISEGDYPHFYTEIRTIFQFTGKNLPHDIIADAVEKSENKYCEICATLKKAVKIINEVKIINA